MRRVAAAVVVAGCVFVGIGSGLGRQPVIVNASLSAVARPAAIPIIRPVTGSATKTTKMIEFAGYQISVPVSWPVYWLNKDPQQCVRYDVHAVYLGTPGADQQCPPGLIGRTETVSIGGPAAPGGLVMPAKTGQGAVLPGKRAMPGTIMQYAQQQEFAVAMPASAPAISATYGADPALVEQILSTIKRLEPQPSPSAGSAASRRTQSPGAARPKAAVRSGDNARLGTPASLGARTASPATVSTSAQADTITPSSMASWYLWEYAWLIALAGLPVPWTLPVPEASPAPAPEASTSPGAAPSPKASPVPNASASLKPSPKASPSPKTSPSA